MNNDVNNKKKNILIGGLIAVVVIMTIGYAAFLTNLTINGTSYITSNWCVGFDSTRTDDYVATAGHANAAAPTASIAFDGNVCETNYKTHADLNASFTQPGDKVVYTLTIVNKSSVDAAIESITVDGNTVSSAFTTTKGNIIFTVGMPQSSTLAASTGTTTMTVTAEFQNTTDLTNFTTNERQSISIGINAVQSAGGSSGGESSSTFTGAIYRVNTEHVRNGDSIVSGVLTGKWIIANSSGVQGPSNVYETQETCQAGYTGYGSPSGYSCQQQTTRGVGEYKTVASELNSDIYLKHDVKDDIVTATYVCFVFSDAEHCMKAFDSASYEANKQILEEYQTAYNLPSNNNPGCMISTATSTCYGGDFYQVSANSSGLDVNVYSKGTTRCYLSGDTGGAYSVCSV